jgi:hypothetical protein
MTKHAVGVMNPNFRNGDYYHYAREVSGSAKKLCPVCEKSSENKPMYLVGKTNLCYGCYEESKLELIPHPVEQASAMDYDTDAEARETAEFCSVAEPQETVSNLEEFTQADEDERQDTYLLGMGA